MNCIYCKKDIILGDLASTLEDGTKRCGSCSFKLKSGYTIASLCKELEL